MNSLKLCDVLLEEETICHVVHAEESLTTASLSAKQFISPQLELTSYNVFLTLARSSPAMRKVQLSYHHPSRISRLSVFKME